MEPEFGKLLRTLRIARRLTMAELATALDVTVPFISNVELGREAPLSQARIDQVAQLLGADASQLHAAAQRSRRRFVIDNPRSGLAREALAGLMRTPDMTDDAFWTLVAEAHGKDTNGKA